MTISLALFQVDAFTGQLFAGNPAAVIPLDRWLPDELLQHIAMENNLSETAFFVKKSDGYALRWFTPAREVDLCGHATLATAYVIFEKLKCPRDEIRFSTRSGALIVRRSGDSLSLDFPAIRSFPAAASELRWFERFEPIEMYKSQQDIMAILKSESAIKSFSTDWRGADFAGHRGLIVTARGDDCDFVSRCFYPELSVDEDPVTGSAHCQMAPYWATRLGKDVLRAKQLSKRGGEILCEMRGDRVILNGKAVLYMEGNIHLEV